MKKIISLLLVLVLGGGAAWYFYSSQQPETHPSVITPVEETVSEPAPVIIYPVAPVVTTQEVPAVPLPALADSDPGMVDTLSGLIGPQVLASHFVLDQVINRVVATVDSLDSKQVAPLVLPVQPLPGKFQVLGDEAVLSSPQNADRYQPLMQILSVVDLEKLVAVYRRYYPLFQESYESLGHEDAYFNDRLVEIVDHLVKTPQLSEDPELVKVEAQYQYADPGLEGLSAGQKMILRSGPSNAVIILQRLNDLRAALVRQGGPG